MVKLAIKCSLNRDMIYSNLCDDKNKRRGCENSVCKPLRDLVERKQRYSGATLISGVVNVNTWKEVKDENNY